MTHKNWTDDHITILKDLYPQENVTTDHLQQLLGRTQRALHHKALALGLRRPTTLWTQQQIELLKRMYPDSAVSAQDMECALSRRWAAIKAKASKLKLLRPNRNKYDVNRKYFKIIDTPTKAYLLGLLAADGAIDPKKGAYKVTLMLQFKDKILINRFINEIAPTTPITINRNTFSVSIHGKEICEDLAKYGIGARKSTNLRWPEALPQEFTIPFILGYFDGDGTLCQVNSRGHQYWQWVLLGCQDFLATAKQHIEHYAQVPINGPIRTDKHRSPHLYRIYVGKQQSIQKIDAILNASGLGLPRKHFADNTPIMR